MNITLKPCTGKYISAAKRLYLSAFPKDERAPFALLMSRHRKGKAQMLAALDEERFAGLAYVVCIDDMVYLFYLAVQENLRGKGAGGQIIEQIIKMHPNKRVFLSREQLDETADNYEQRVKRRKFYLNCGLSDWGLCVREGKMTYSVMGIGKRVTPQEYDKLITSWSGRIIKLFFDMSLYECEDAK